MKTMQTCAGAVAMWPSATLMWDALLIGHDINCALDTPLDHCIGCQDQNSVKDQPGESR